MRATILLTALAVVMLTGPAKANFKSGNQLLQECSTPGADQICLGYIQGIVDAETDMARTCLPGSVTPGQARDIAIKLLDDHPELRHYTASSLVTRALAEAFPCRFR
jgi:hypothetical protein